MNERTNGQTNGLRDEQTDGLTGGERITEADGRTSAQASGLTEGRTPWVGRTMRLKDGQRNERSNQRNGWTKRLTKRHTGTNDKE